MLNISFAAIDCASSLLLSLGSSLGWGGFGLGGSLWLVLLGNWHSLTILGQLVEHVTASTAGVSVWVVGHVGT